MLIAIIILSLMVVTLTFTTINLLRKNEFHEDSEETQQKILLAYFEYIEKISKVIEISDYQLKQLDVKGSFSSDDEIGFFFKGVKDIQGILNEFKVK